MQVEALGLIDKWEDIRKMYAKVNHLLGDLIKVTPSSKVVGDLALFLVQNNIQPEELQEKGENLSFPDSVVSFFKGMLGQPYGGFPEDLKEIVLKDEEPLKERPGKLLEDYDFNKAKKELEDEFKREFTDEEIVSYALYPAVFRDYVKFVEIYGDASVFDTKSFFYPLKKEEEIDVDIEEGKTLIIKYLSMGEPNEKGCRRVYFELNGQPRNVNIKDEKLTDIIKSNEKGDLSDPHDICATMPGKIVKINVKEGDDVKKDDLLVVTEAMKIETKIKCGISGKVAKIYLNKGDKIEAGDLIIKLN